MPNYENNYYLTFPTKYARERHPKWEGVDPDGWVRIVAHNYERARVLAIAYFGENWAFLYGAEDFEGDPQRDYLYPVGELSVITEDDGMEQSQPLRTLRRRDV